MTDWIIFYDDGSNFSSDDGGPEDAPRDGVQVIAVHDISVGRALYWNSDTYCWDAGRWIPHCDKGCERYLSREKWPIRLRGYWIADERFRAIYDQAVRDPRLPAKTANSPRERVTYSYEEDVDK